MAAEREELRRWLFQYCEDLGELEILARLRDVRDGEPLNEVEIATLSGLTPEMTQEALRRLSSRELLASTGAPPRYRYAIVDPESRERVNQVIEVYRAQPVEIMSLLTANALERVRTAAVSTFAECFRFGGPKSRG